MIWTTLTDAPSAPRVWREDAETEAEQGARRKAEEDQEDDEEDQVVSLAVAFWRWEGTTGCGDCFAGWNGAGGEGGEGLCDGGGDVLGWWAWARWTGGGLAVGDA